MEEVEEVEVVKEVVVVVKLYRSSYIVSQPGRSAELCPLPASRSPFSLWAWITGRGGVVAGHQPHSQGDQLWEWWAAWWWGPGPRVGPWQDYPASNTPNIMDGESLVSSRWFITITILWLLSAVWTRPVRAMSNWWMFIFWNKKRKQTDSILHTDLSSPNLQILARIIHVTNEPLKFKTFF